MCPATIDCHSKNNGLQVFFYPNHLFHDFKLYETSESGEQFTISPNRNYLSDKTQRLKEFKEVMEDIVKKADELNISELNNLHEMALDMQMKLNNIMSQRKTENKDESLSVAKRKSYDITDKDVRVSKRIKQKNQRQSLTEETSIPEESAGEKSAPKIVNTFTLAKINENVNLPEKTNSDTEATKVAQTEETDVKTTDKKAIININDKPENIPEVITKPSKVTFDDGLSSFNDSYKSFIEKSIGQKLASKKDLPEISPKDFYNKTNGTDEKKKISTSTNTELSDTTVQAVASEIDVVKESQDKKRVINKKKPKVKTRLGQFSPKKSSSSGLSNKSSPLFNKSLSKPIIDIEYEVKERENDYNILILKI